MSCVSRRPRSPWIAGLAVGALVACSARADEEPGDAASTLEGAQPVVLVATSPEAAARCPDETTATYCSEQDAARAAERCNERLSARERRRCDAAQGCLATYAPARAGCRAGPTYPTPEACARPVFDDCSFYRACLEAGAPCGEDGYALGFGERLCARFVARRSEFSAAGQAWLRGVRSCLQISLVPLLGEATSCASLADRAYETHTACYTTGDASVCTLGAADLITLLRMIGADLFEGRALRQVRDLALACTRRLFEGERATPRGDAQARATFFAELARASSDPDELRSLLDRSEAPRE